MLVEVLLALQAVTADGDAVVGGVEDVRVVELARRLELPEHPADLEVDVLAARELAAHFVADGPLVAALPDAADGDLVAEAGVAVGERVRGQVVGGELRARGFAGGGRSLSV